MEVVQNVKDVSGQTFGNLVVIERAENDRHGGHRYLVECSCGTERIVNKSALLSGATKSCRRKHDVGYVGAHHRITAIRGKASSRPCERCEDGTPAQQWAYVGGDLWERVQAGGKEDGRRYSTNVWAYIPLCRVHHKAMDNQSAAIRALSIQRLPDEVLDEYARKHNVVSSYEEFVR